MGYTTKFNIGEKVWFVDTEIIDGKICECCGERAKKTTIKKVKYKFVKEITINDSSEYYQLGGRILAEKWLFKTKEEAEQSLNSDN